MLIYDKKHIWNAIDGVLKTNKQTMNELSLIVNRKSKFVIDIDFLFGFLQLLMTTMAL